jgi:septation ring formation regulator EzrA
MQVRAEAVRVKEQVSNAAAAARKLATSRRSNFAGSLDSFSKNLASLKSTLASGREVVGDVNDQTAAYFTKWDEQLRGMSEDLQKSGQKRKAEAMASFDAVRGDLAEVRSSLKPFVDELSEVEKYLQMDQTKAGLNTVSSRLTSTAERWPVIRRDLDKLIQRIDAIQR